jgi:hypothetical protein
MGDSAVVDFAVELDEQHLKRLGATEPITGVTELIWNALDADADEVRVEFARNALDGIEEVRIVDDGHGMTQQEIVDAFGRLGGSWKRTAKRSKKGRGLHGRDGRGRFLAAGLGGRLRWHTVAEDPDDPSRRLALDVELTVSHLSQVEVSDPVPTEEPTGTRVLIDGFAEEPPGLNGEKPVEKLTGIFGLYLQTNNAHLAFDGTEIDPEKLQVNKGELDVPTPPGTDPALLVVVEWNRRVDRALYLCDERGTPLGEVAPGIQAPGFEFTAYINWTGFQTDNSLAAVDMGGGGSKAVIEEARDKLRDYFKERARGKTRELIEEWKAENVYPFEGEPRTPAERVARDTFDVVALSASGAVNASEKSGRRLSLRLLREALENDPGSLRKVLGEVLDLKQDRLEELSALLDRTPLTAMIATSKEIADRLEFLRGLEEIALGDVSKHVKERSQLHRILAGQTWVFGEEYALAADDNSLTNVLRNHLSYLGREELAADVSDEVLDAEGSRGVVDLMLARSLSQQKNRREHLVIELKAPKVKVGDEQAQQIRRYANAVFSDPRFNTKDVDWDFVVVSGEVTGLTDRERRDPKTPYGQITDADGVRVYVWTWADVLDAAGHRLKFVRDLLEYQPDAEQALAYLKATHEKYLPEQVASAMQEPGSR